MHLMNDVLQEHLDICGMVFFCDVLVYLENWQEREAHLWQVLIKLREQGLYAKVLKYQFAVTEIDSLGQKVAPKKCALLKKNYEPSESGSAPVMLGVSGLSWDLLIAISGTFIGMLKL